MKRILPLILVLFALESGAQQTLKGQVIDLRTGEPLANASVKIDRKNVAISDTAGQFTAALSQGTNTILITCVGYADFHQTLQVRVDEQYSLRFAMQHYSNELERVVISGSKHEKQLAREPVSIVSIQPYLIANTNSNTLSDVLNRVPGISVVDGQAIIRGGVGWSYNVGSRVMVLLDGMPLMGPDIGDVQWDLLPIEAAENIEVMKGPASVLYGSAASSGTVSVNTGWPTNKPSTTIQFYQGITDNPKSKQSIWWHRTSQPFNTGAFFSHKQKFGQFDLVVSGNVDATRSYIELNDQYRMRSYLKSRYRFKSIPGLSAGINGNLLFKKGGRFTLWEDADSNILRPFSGSSGEDFYRIWSFDPHLVYMKPDNYTISFRLRHYNITRFADPLLNRSNDAIANMQALDLNLQKSIVRGLSNTTGIYLTEMWAVGNVYPGNQSGYSAAVFSELEYRFGRFTANGGVRYEVNALGAIEQSPGLLKRAGINFQAAKKTFIRATYGEGFRFPVIGERLVDDKVANFLRVLPNPGLKSEFGWYAELGAKQGFKIGQFNATIDYSFFWQEYENLIQFQFAQWKNDSFYLDYSNLPPTPVVVHGLIGFKAININKTRTAGMELSLEGEGKIGEIGIRTLTGYTYTYPVDLDADPYLKDAGKYLYNMFTAYDGLNTRQKQSILTYRNRKLIKSDIEFTYKKMAFGYGLFYYSVYDKIDPPLYTLIPGMGNFLDRVGDGDWIHNIRGSYNLNPNATLALLINNLANHEYGIRPGKIDSPRTISIQMRLTF